MTDKYLERYKGLLEAKGLPKSRNIGNKLRDAEDKYTADGHSFSFNKELLFSFDVCGNCEAHAIMFSMASDSTHTVQTAPSLVDIDHTLLEGHVNFVNCL